MKQKISLLLAALLLSITGYSQTNIPTPTLTPGGFFDSIPAYLTSHDMTTMVAQGSHIEIFNDMVSGSILGLSGMLGGRINFTVNTNTAPLASTATWFVVGSMRYGGIGGTISGGDGGIGYSWIKYDTRISLKLSGGYDKGFSGGAGAGYVSPGFWLEKVTSKVVPGIGIEVPMIFEKSGKMTVSSTPQFVVKLSIPF